MNAIAGLLMSIWVISLPFKHISIIGTLSIDNILGPVLILLWPFVKRTNDLVSQSVRVKHTAIIAIIVFLYYFSHVSNLLMTQEMAWFASYILISDLVYFVVPVLYLSDEKLRIRVDDLIIVITIIGCLSAILASMGIIHIPDARMGASRIGISWLPKTVGLIGAYGDMALLISYTFLLTITGKNNRLLFGKNNIIKMLTVYVIIFAGFAGSQSRNMLLTLGSVICILIYLEILRNAKQKKWRTIFFSTIGVAGLVAALSLTYYGDTITETLSSAGGSKEAAATANARLEQYNFAWDVLKETPLTGADREIQIKYAIDIIFIHNMWLKELVQGGVFAIFTIIALAIIGMQITSKALLYDPNDYYARARLIFIIVMFISTQFNPSGTPIFWMLLGVSIVRLNIRKPSPIV